MSGPKFYRPKKKHFLIAHLDREHRADGVQPIVPHRWTMAALVELHDGIHKARIVTDEAT